MQSLTDCRHVGVMALSRCEHFAVIPPNPPPHPVGHTVLTRRREDTQPTKKLGPSGRVVASVRSARLAITTAQRFFGRHFPA